MDGICLDIQSDTTGNVHSGRDRTEILTGRHSTLPTGDLTREGAIGEAPVTESRNHFGFQIKEIREKYQGIPGRFFCCSIGDVLLMRLSFRR